MSTKTKNTKEKYSRGDLSNQRVLTSRLCSVKGCNNKHFGLGLCWKHYYQLNKKTLLNYQTEYRKQNKNLITKYMKKYYEKNKEEILKKCQQYYQEYKKQHLKSSKKYREKNKNYFSKYAKNYYKQNEEKIVEYKKQYYKKNKVKLYEKQKLYNQTIRGKAIIKASRHKRRISETDLTKEIIQKVYEDNIKKYRILTCILCGRPIKFGEDSLEHKTPLSKGGNNDYENLGIAHGKKSKEKCNIRKFTKTLEEWNKIKGGKNYGG